MVNFNKIFEETLMVESFENKVLFSVDIQPSAESYIHFNIYEFTNFLNENIDKFKEIVYFFNGPELGFESQSEIEMWLLENELTEDTLDSITFYEKNYGYFRSCMDSGFLNDDLIKLISYMYMNDIVDSRDIDLKKLNIDEELKDFLENDMIYIPDIMEFIDRNYDNIILTGGHRNACLSEVEVALMALDKKYQFLEKFIYE